MTFGTGVVKIFVKRKCRGMSSLRDSANEAEEAIAPPLAPADAVRLRWTHGGPRPRPRPREMHRALQNCDSDGPCPVVRMVENGRKFFSGKHQVTAVRPEPERRVPPAQ